MNEADYYDLIFEEPPEGAHAGGRGGISWRREFIEKVATEARGQWVRWPRDVTVDHASTLCARIRRGVLDNYKGHAIRFPEGTWEARWAKHEGRARVWIRCS